MTMTPRHAAPAALDTSSVRKDQFAATDGRPRRTTPLMRKIEVACLDPRGDLVETSRIVPAIHAFERAVSAFARGALFATDRGVVAVEDLLPGDAVKVADGSFRTLLWRGSTLIVPGHRGQDEAMGRLTRISADALGIARPMHDLILGPAARLVHRAPSIESTCGSDRALVPAVDFVDGVAVFQITPPTPQQVYHLGFEAHERLVVNGVEVESYHPGPAHALGLNREMGELFMSLFPHKSDFASFGRACLPRLSMADVDLFRVA